MQIAPSILSVLNKDLTSILNKVESSGIKYIHLDVMDNILTLELFYRKDKFFFYLCEAITV